MKSKFTLITLLLLLAFLLFFTREGRVESADVAAPAAAPASAEPSVAVTPRLEGAATLNREAVPAGSIGETASTVGAVHLIFKTAAKDLGLKASLLAVGSGDSQGIAMTATNNEIWWSDLAPGQYRWRLGSQAVVKISPRFEVARVTFDSEGSARTNDPPPSDLSGVFLVKAGETTELESEVEEHAGITGVLVEAAQAEALSSVIVRLRHREVFSNPVKPGQDVYINDTEGSGRPDQDGRFLLTPVKPGEKVLTVSWRVGEDFFYSTQKFSVVPGEIVDLGGIYCQAGLTVTGLIRFQTPTGEHVSKELLFGEGVEPKLDMIFNSGSDVPTENGISEFFHPSLDRPFVIHGLVPGDYFVLVEPDGEGWPSVKGGISIAQRKTAEVEFDVRKQSSFEVNLLADALCQFKLSAVIPNAASAPYLRGVLVNGREAYEVQLSPAGGDPAPQNRTSADLTLRVEPPRS